MRTLEDVAGAVGTPFYAYDADLFRERIARFRAAFGDTAPEVCYALKANDALALVAVAAGEGLGADIVSGGELAKALRAGIPAGRVVFSGVGKTRAEIAAALQAGVRALNVESLGELEAIAEEAAALGVVAPVSVRLNPDVEANTHAYVATGSAASKFGLGLDDARAAYERAAEHPALEPIGISFHVGSQLLDTGPVLAAAERAAELWRELGATGIELRDLDAGGGLGIAYDDGADADVDAYAAALSAIAGDLGARLVLEPGRWLVGPVGTFVTRVLYVKDAPGRRIAVCDGGMNDLIRPALYGARHPIDPARPGRARAGDGRRRRARLRIRGLLRARRGTAASRAGRPACDRPGRRLLPGDVFGLQRPAVLRRGAARGRRLSRHSRADRDRRPGLGRAHLTSFRKGLYFLK